MKVKIDAMSYLHSKGLLSRMKEYLLDMSDFINKAALIFGICVTIANFNAMFMCFSMVVFSLVVNNARQAATMDILQELLDNAMIKKEKQD